MSGTQPGRRGASTLLHELRVWDRRARRGVFPKTEAIDDWQRAVEATLPSDRAESLELQLRLAAITASVLAHRPAPGQPGVEPAPRQDVASLWRSVLDAPPRGRLRNLANRVAEELAALRVSSPNGEGESPAGARIGSGSVRARDLAFSSPAVSGSTRLRLVHSEALPTSLSDEPQPDLLRTLDFVRSRELLGTGFLEYLQLIRQPDGLATAYTPLDMPFVLDTDLELDWLEGEPDPFSVPRVIVPLRRAVESLTSQGARVNLIRGSEVPADEYRPEEARSATDLVVAGLFGPVSLGGFPVFEHAVTVAERPGRLHLLLAPGAVADALVLPPVEAPDSPIERQSGNHIDAAITERTGNAPALSREPVDSGRLKTPPTALAAELRPVVPDRSVTDAPPASSDQPSGPEIALPGEPTPSMPVPEESAVSPVPSFGSEHRHFERQDATGRAQVIRRSSPATDDITAFTEPGQTARIAPVLTIALDWVSGEDPWRHPEEIARLTIAAQSVVRAAGRVAIVRGREVPLERYRPAEGVSSQELVLLGTGRPIPLAGLSFLDGSNVQTQRPGYIQVLVAPRTYQESDRPDGGWRGAVREYPELVLAREEDAVKVGESASPTAAGESVTARPALIDRFGQPSVATGPRVSPNAPATRGAGVGDEYFGLGSRQISGLLPAVHSASDFSDVISARALTTSSADGLRVLGREAERRRVEFESRESSGILPSQETVTHRVLVNRDVDEELPSVAEPTPSIHRQPPLDLPLIVPSFEEEPSAAAVPPTGRSSEDLKPTEAAPSPALQSRPAPVDEPPALGEAMYRETTTLVAPPVVDRSTHVEPDVLPPRADVPSSIDTEPPSASGQSTAPAPGMVGPLTREPLAAPPGVETIRLTLDWVSGEDPWENSVRLEEAGGQLRDIAAPGVRFELVRGREVPLAHYDVSRAVSSADLGLVTRGGPVVLAGVGLLDAANLIAERPGSLQVLVAPHAVAPSGSRRLAYPSPADLVLATPEDAGESVADPSSAQPGRIASRMSRGDLTPAIADWQVARHPFESSALSLATGPLQRTLALPTVGDRPPEPFPSLPASPVQEAAIARLSDERRVIEITLDWVTGADPWEQPATIESARAAARELTTFGIEVVLRRGREFPRPAYQPERAQQSSDFAVIGPHGRVLLTPMNLLGGANVISQRPDAFEVVLAPEVLSRPSEWALPTFPSLVFSAEPGAPEGAVQESADLTVGASVGPGSQSRAQFGRTSTAAEIIQVVLDWVVGSEPRSDQLTAIAADLAGRVAGEGIRFEVLPGRAVSPAEYREAPSEPAGAFVLRTTRGAIPLGDEAWLEGAVLRGQRPGLLHVLLPPSTSRSADGTPTTPELTFATTPDAKAENPPGSVGLPEPEYRRLTRFTDPASTLALRTAPAASAAQWLPRAVEEPGVEPETLWSARVNRQPEAAADSSRRREPDDFEVSIGSPGSAAVAPSFGETELPALEADRFAAALVERVSDPSGIATRGGFAGSDPGWSGGAFGSPLWDNTSPMNILVYDVTVAESELGGGQRAANGRSGSPRGTSIGSALTYVHDRPDMRSETQPYGLGDTASGYVIPSTLIFVSDGELMSAETQQAARAAADRQPVTAGAAVQRVQSAASSPGESETPDKAVNLEKLARDVYREIKWRLAVEHERAGTRRPTRGW